MINRLKKFLVIISSIFILGLVIIFNFVQAVNLSSKRIVSTGDCGILLRYKGVDVITYFACYDLDGVFQPAYCLNKDKQGVDSLTFYDVTVQKVVEDNALQNVIRNGYPYKTYLELGCLNKEEAFTATKQAIYCTISENNVDDYEAVGDAGVRTLNALRLILNNSKKELSDVEEFRISEEQEDFEVDKVDDNYISKIYSINTKGLNSNYYVSIQKDEVKSESEQELESVQINSQNNQNEVENHEKLDIKNQLSNFNIEDIKVTDLDNKQKISFEQGEKFKLLIPVKKLTDNITFKIVVSCKVKSKKILYAKAENNNYQDCALTSDVNEEIKRCLQEKFDFKLKIIKQDEKPKERLKSVNIEKILPVTGM